MFVERIIKEDSEEINFTFEKRGEFNFASEKLQNFPEKVVDRCTVNRYNNLCVQK